MNLLIPRVTAKLVIVTNPDLLTLLVTTLDNVHATLVMQESSVKSHVLVDLQASIALNVF